jgi:hypothetical protein
MHVSFGFVPRQRPLPFWIGLVLVLLGLVAWADQIPTPTCPLPFAYQKNLYEIARVRCPADREHSILSSQYRDSLDRPWYGEHELFGAWNGVQVDSRTELSYSEFVTEYASKQQPVVIKGVFKDLPLATMSWHEIEAAYGDVTIEPKVEPDPNGESGNDRNCAGWADLCEGDEISISELILDHILPSMDPNSNRTGPYMYCHDESVEKSFPGIYEDYRTLSLFADNIFAMERDEHWPSIFFAPKGTKSGLHIDNHGSAFTMAVFQGRKQFLTFSPSDYNHLCPTNTYKDIAVDNRYQIDSFAPDFGSCPQAHLATPYFYTLERGDVIYLPGNFIHAARNLEGGIGVSRNFVGINNFKTFRQHAESLEWVSDSTNRVGAYLELVDILEDSSYRVDLDAAPLMITMDHSRAIAQGLIKVHIEHNRAAMERLKSGLSVLLWPDDDLLHLVLERTGTTEIADRLEHHQLSDLLYLHHDFMTHLIPETGIRARLRQFVNERRDAFLFRLIQEHGMELLWHPALSDGRYKYSYNSRFTFSGVGLEDLRHLVPDDIESLFITSRDRSIFQHFLTNHPDLLQYLQYNEPHISLKL